ncbi:dTDP-4-dehydrorhamnose 3,5-epimerase [Rhodobacteraceae bacterium LMO-12]|nr:dTDP-4-dehydrorhamnose 3,5-epimerase [Rhodobacteraceae bacterium LMO-JJ12]
MKIEETILPGVLVLTPDRFGDHRGWFSESWNRTRMQKAGLDYDFVQDNHSLSAQAGTLRGLHFQIPPHEQVKLVRCGRGALYDVAVDIRKGSPTYGQWVGEVLTPDNGRQLLIPDGFAHGFVTLSAQSEVIYKVAGAYEKAAEGAIRWDSCAIRWPWAYDVELKEADATAPTLAEFDSPFVWKG